MAEAFALAASALAVIELSAKVTKACTQYAKGVSGAKGDIERLQTEVKGLDVAAKNVQRLANAPSNTKLSTVKELQPTMEDSKKCLEGLQAALSPGKGKAIMSKFGMRALTWPFKSKEMEKILADLGRLMQSISVAMQVDQTATLLDLAQKSTLARLPVAEGAAFDSHADEHNPQCLPDTRVEVLREIREWAQDPYRKSIYWLNGMAGTGKSTISRTLAHSFASSQTLGATFFFKRGGHDRGGMAKFFTTIANQLVQQVPEMAARIQEAMDDDPAIISKALRVQLDTLILRPLLEALPDALSRLPADYLRLIFIIDALDECHGEENVKVLIKLLAGVKTPPSLQLKFFLTSRPELPIRLGFRSVDGTYQDFILHEVEAPVIEHDIAAYLRHELRMIQKNFDGCVADAEKLSADWPSQADLHILVQMAVPLFIFAATVCRFISDSRVDSPDAQLQKVLRYQADGQGSRLDATYLPVLDQMIAGLHSRDADQVLERFQKVIGSIIILATPLTTSTLARLLEIPTSRVDSALRTLHSVFQIPASDQEPVRTLHSSFRDFLVDPARQNSQFWVDEQETHRQLAVQCLRMLSTLETDILKVGAPGTLASSISPEEINAKLPPETQYACQFWTYHLQASPADRLDTSDIWDFLSLHFLHWLEALSWMGILPDSLHMIKALQPIFSLGPYQQISDFLSDSIRFILASSTGIQMAPLQAYSSALIFTPHHSVVRGIYNDMVGDWIGLKPQVLSTWSQNLQTLEGHNDIIESIAFSPDGKVLASTGGQKLQLWDVDTSVMLQTLEGGGSVTFSPSGKLLAFRGHEGPKILDVDTGAQIHSFNIGKSTTDAVMFSPDGNILATLTGSTGEVFQVTINLWDVFTGARIQTFKDHHGVGIAASTFSPDSKMLAFESHYDTVQLFDIQTGSLLKTFKGHNDSVTSVVFSPDGEMLASSGDCTVRLWSVITGAPLRTLSGHARRVTSAIFSPDSKTLVSASRDMTVRLWDVDTGMTRQIVDGFGGYANIHTGYPHDGKILAFSGYDMVRLCDASTGAMLHTLHTGTRITRIAFSPYSCMLATGSSDHQIRLWDTTISGPSQAQEGHSSYVSQLGFSPNGKLLASFGDGGVRLWDVLTGTSVQTLRGSIGPFSFSPNGEMIAAMKGSGSTIGFWDVETGCLLREIDIPMPSGKLTASNIAFSPNAQMVAAGARTDSYRILILSTGTGTLLHTLKYTTLGGPKSSVFSPDGQKLAAVVLGEGTVGLWCVREGTLLMEFKTQGDPCLVAFSPDCRTLAAATNKEAVELWDTTTGTLLQILNIGVPTETLRFSIGGDKIITDAGISDIRSPDRFLASSNDTPHSSPISGHGGTHPGRPQALGLGISRNRRWITYNSQDILWIPADFRLSCLAILQDTVAFGCRSGRVLRLRFQLSLLDTLSERCR